MSAETATYPSRSAENQHKYYEKFYEKCKEQGTHTCPVCFGSYTYFNKSHHNKTAHHIKAVQYQEKMKTAKLAKHIQE